MPPDGEEGHDAIWTEIRDLRKGFNNHVGAVAKTCNNINSRLARIETTLQHVPSKADLVELQGKVSHQASDWEKAWELFKLPVAAAIGAAMPYVMKALANLF